MTFRDSAARRLEGGTAGNDRWTQKGKKLTLKIVEDRCPGRPLILAGAPFTKTG